MFITKQLDILPPHLEENMYDVNMLLKEIFSDNDTEIFFHSQDSDSNATRDEIIVDEADDNETIHHRAMNLISTQMGNYMQLVIIDSGADCHIGGKHWLPLSPTTGTYVKRASILGL